MRLRRDGLAWIGRVFRHSAFASRLVSSRQPRNSKFQTRTRQPRNLNSDSDSDSRVVVSCGLDFSTGSTTTTMTTTLDLLSSSSSSEPIRVRIAPAGRSVLVPRYDSSTPIDGLVVDHMHGSTLNAGGHPRMMDGRTGGYVTIIFVSS